MCSSWTGTWCLNRFLNVPFLITPGSIITIVRHATAVLSVLAVCCCIQIPSSVTPDWQLGRRHAGNALDSRRQDRHYPRKLALITSTNGRHPPSNLESSVSHFSHKASLFSCNLSKSLLRQDPIPSKWGRRAKILGCASDPPVCSLLVWEDWMRTQVFFAHLYHLGPSGGDFKASRRNCM